MQSLYVMMMIHFNGFLQEAGRIDAFSVTSVAMKRPVRSPPKERARIPLSVPIPGEIRHIASESEPRVERERYADYDGSFACASTSTPGENRSRRKGGYMDQARTARVARSAGFVPSFHRPAPSGPLPEPPESEGRSDQIQDMLGSITDRPDLEKLFARHVGLDAILKLMGRRVSREKILALIESQNLEDDLRQLLK